MQKTPFLKEIAAHVLKSGTYDLDNTCIVFPHKRARIYFSKYLGELTGKPIWAPRYRTINELMESLSDMIYADKLTLVFELYRLYTDMASSGESFDLFYPFCETLLADFDEMDKYLVNADDLFQNLSDLKIMEGRFSYLTEEQVKAIQRFWNTFEPGQVSPGQETFLSIWNLLPELYGKFRERLKEKGLAYEGMVYRHVAERIRASGSLAGLDVDQYLFVGFNALNRCEEVLFRFMRNAGKAVFLYDYDSFYVNNAIHEAGYFIRKNLKDFPQVLEMDHDNLTDDGKHIVFLPVASNVGQAKALSAVIRELPGSPGKDADHTAIVLADETLLLPVLYALPQEIDEINITMGYPASETAAFSLIDSLYELHRHARKGHAGGMAYHHRNILSVINNPLLRDIFDEGSCGIREGMSKSGQAYITAGWISRLTGDGIIFRNEGLAGQAAAYLLETFEYIIRGLLPEKEEGPPVAAMQLEGLYQTYAFLTRLQDILTQTDVDPGMDGVFRLARKFLRQYRIPFSGEPLAGLQVMGLLETRTIDFDNVVILSANEGVLPGTNHFPSLIPYNLRQGFGMPTAEHHDAMYAYYFYRLLQRARNIVLVYNNSTDGMRTGERSRFLHQLYYELPAPVEESSLVFNVSHIRPKQITLEKDARVMRELAKFTGPEGKVLTPSAINEFLNCSLKFYFHYVSALPQQEEVSDLVDARLFGNLLHKSMKLLFESMGTSHASHNVLENMLSDHEKMDDLVDNAFREELYGPGYEDSMKIDGFNLIIKQILIKYIRQLIRFDMTLAPFEIISLEDRYQAAFPLEIGGIQCMIRVGGIIDRVDRHRGSVRILDYKTGKIKNTFPDIESLFTGRGRERYDAVLQVLLYALVYSSRFPGDPVVPGLVFIRESHRDDFSYDVSYGKDHVPVRFLQLEPEFRHHLGHHLARIFDEKEPFSQTDNLKICSYCSYAGICHRKKER